MQEFLKAIHREIKTTFLFVTHDQEEAIAMADRICVMNFGKILQLGTPTEVYYRPRSEFVARFFGDNNLIEGVVTPGAVETPIGKLSCASDGMTSPPSGGKAFAMVRPEAIRIGAGDGSDTVVAGQIASVNFGGAATVAVVDVAGVSLRVKLPSRVEGLPVRQGDRVQLGWRAEDCRLVVP
jgi:spermidine/putrescine transport system ATP-binding protein